MNTPTALQRLARRALLIRAKADAGLVSLVPAANIDPDGTPEWPIILIESPTARGRRASCVRGADVSFDVHAFAREKKNAADVTIQTGYTHVSAIGAEIERVFADNWITLENGARCKLSFSDMRLLKDAAPDDWHWFAQLNCRVMAAAA